MGFDGFPLFDHPASALASLTFIHLNPAKLTTLTEEKVTLCTITVLNNIYWGYSWIQTLLHNRLLYYG